MLLVPQPATFARRPLVMAGTIGFLSRPALAQGRGQIAIGLTPVFVDSDLELLEAIKRELVKRLGAPVVLVKRRTYQEITAMLLADQVTAAWICGFPFIRDRDQLSILASPIYKGGPLYQSYVIARTDLPAESLADLRGRTHAFSDPNSNSGWLVTRYLLERAGTTPDSFFSRTFFTYGHRNVVRAVGSGLADSGSVDGYVWDVLAEREPGLTRATRIIHRSARFGFPPIACLTAAAQTAPVRQLGAALEDLAGDAGGRSVLSMLRLDGFAPVDASLYDPIAQMYRDIQA